MTREPTNARRVKIALVQMICTESKQANVAQALGRIAEAAAVLRNSRREQNDVTKGS
jgi:hypothetical protein